jgi:hypothetical protein
MPTVQEQAIEWIHQALHWAHLAQLGTSVECDRYSAAHK